MQHGVQVNLALSLRNDVFPHGIENVHTLEEEINEHWGNGTSPFAHLHQETFHAVG
jgi:hypothetical protein